MQHVPTHLFVLPRFFCICVPRRTYLTYYLGIDIRYTYADIYLNLIGIGATSQSCQVIWHRIAMAAAAAAKPRYGCPSCMVGADS